MEPCWKATDIQPANNWGYLFSRPSQNDLLTAGNVRYVLMSKSTCLWHSCFFTKFRKKTCWLAESTTKSTVLVYGQPNCEARELSKAKRWTSILANPLTKRSIDVQQDNIQSTKLRNKELFRPDDVCSLPQIHHWSRPIWQHTRCAQTSVFKHEIFLWNKWSEIKTESWNTQSLFNTQEDLFLSSNESLVLSSLTRLQCAWVPFIRCLNCLNVQRTCSIKRCQACHPVFSTSVDWWLETMQHAEALRTSATRHQNDSGVTWHTKTNSSFNHLSFK